VWDGKLVSTDRSTVLDGTRALAIAQFGRTWREPGWYVKPALQMHLRQYQFEQALGSGQSSLGLAIPTASLDSGMFFERDTSFFGRALVQTLEPRLYYSRTPYREQGFLPTYDSAPFDFNLATVFLSNPYAGQDRVADLNAVTLGATSRLLHPETGAELLSLGMAQRYRFSEQRVGMPTEAPVAAGVSDLLLGGRLQWTPQWSTSGTVQYNPETGSSTRSTLGVRYNPGYYRVLKRRLPGQPQHDARHEDARRRLAMAAAGPVRPGGAGWRAGPRPRLRPMVRRRTRQLQPAGQQDHRSAGRL